MPIDLPLLTVTVVTVDKPVVGRLTAWCAYAWLAVHFPMVGAHLLLGEGSQKKQANLRILFIKGTWSGNLRISCT